MNELTIGILVIVFAGLSWLHGMFFGIDRASRAYAEEIETMPELDTGLRTRILARLQLMRYASND